MSEAVLEKMVRSVSGVKRAIDSGRNVSTLGRYHFVVPGAEHHRGHIVMGARGNGAYHIQNGTGGCTVTVHDTRIAKNGRGTYLSLQTNAGEIRMYVH